MCMTYHISGMTFKTNGTFLLLLNERVIWEWGCQSKWQWYVNKSDMNDLFSSISKGELISESFSLRLKSLKRGAKKLSSAFCLNVSRSQKKLSSRKNQTNEFVFLSWRLGNTWNQNSSFKYFRVVRIEKQTLFWDLLTFSRKGLRLVFGTFLGRFEPQWKTVWD